MKNVRNHRHCRIKECISIVYSGNLHTKFCFHHSAEYLNVFYPHASRSDFKD